LTGEIADDLAVNTYRDRVHVVRVLGLRDEDRDDVMPDAVSWRSAAQRPEFILIVRLTDNLKILLARIKPPGDT
jgi:hypothetical protein